MKFERIAELRALAEESTDYTRDSYIDIHDGPAPEERRDMAFLTIARGAMIEALDAIDRLNKVLASTEKHLKEFHGCEHQP